MDGFAHNEIKGPVGREAQVGNPLTTMPMADQLASVKSLNMGEKSAAVTPGTFPDLHITDVANSAFSNGQIAFESVSPTGSDRNSPKGVSDGKIPQIGPPGGEGLGKPNALIPSAAVPGDDDPRGHDVV
jgi:hypothetical protein